MDEVWDTLLMVVEDVHTLEEEEEDEQEKAGADRDVVDRLIGPSTKLRFWCGF